MLKLLPAYKGKGGRFELSTESESQVFVAGTFNNWNRRAYSLKDNPDSGHFKTALCVPTGTHDYKFVLNRIWPV